MVYSVPNNPVSGPLAGSEFVEIDNGGGVLASATTGQIASAPAPVGGGSAKFGRAGNISTILNAAAVNPANTGGDYVVGFITLPANSFNAANQSVQLSGYGSYAGNGNTKEVKIQASATLPVLGTTIVSGTVLADSGAVTSNGTSWSIAAKLTKYGAVGSNTQLALATAAGVSVPQLLTLAENAPIYLAITANATTTATDIAFSFAQATWDN